MLSKLENKLDMMKQVISVCETWNAVIITVPALVTILNAFKALVAQIDQTLQAQLLIIKGITIDKARAKETLVKALIKVAKAVAAYAHSISDSELEEKMHYSKSALLRRREEILLGIAQIVFSIGTAHNAQILPYGITAAELLSLDDAMKDYSEKMTEPKEARDSRKMNTADLKLLFARADDLLKNEMDRTVEILPDEHTEFKTLYNNGRMIIDYHGKAYNQHPAGLYGGIYGTMLNSETLEPVVNGKIFPEGAEEPIETDEDAYFDEMQVLAGTYKFIATADGCKDHYGSVIILPDQDINFDIMMDPLDPVPPPVPPTP